MTFTVSERHALQFQIAELIEADEPEAVLATLRRIAERMQLRAVYKDQRKICERWARLEVALERVMLDLVGDHAEPARNYNIQGSY